MTCSVDGCDRNDITKGLCSMHYMRWLRHGTTECTTSPIQGRTTKQMLEHTIEDDNGCWIWQGAKSTIGYPMVTISYRQYLVSRLVFEHTYRKLKEGECVCHKCDVPACINPEHLFAGSHEDNSRDMSAKGRAGGTKFPPELLTEIRDKYKAGGILQKDLAAEYGISRTHVNRIVNS